MAELETLVHKTIPILPLIPIPSTRTSFPHVLYTTTAEDGFSAG
jgi:hypothetical protein